MADGIAPLIFVNGADSQSAQIFTLAHERAHVWCGQDGLFNLVGMKPADDRVEKYCNRVAAEFLVPKEKLSGNASAPNASLVAQGASLYFDELLHAKVRQFNPKYTEAAEALAGELQRLQASIFGNRELLKHLRNQATFHCPDCDGNATDG
jgi:hypothetical protein